MLRALRSDTDTNVIATPSAVTMDNQEAKLKVAQEVPFVTGQYTNTSAVTGGTVNPFQTIQREEVGTILKVTPTISTEGEAVVLKIDIESSSLGQQPAGAVDLITSKRKITTNVLIEDGGIVVLGGLIRTTVDQSENARAAPRQHPAHRASCSRTTQRQPDQEQSDDLHPAADPARRTRSGDRDQLQVQLHPRGADAGRVSDEERVPLLPGVTAPAAAGCRRRRRRARRQRRRSPTRQRDRAAEPAQPPLMPPRAAPMPPPPPDPPAPPATRRPATAPQAPRNERAPPP